MWFAIVPSAWILLSALLGVLVGHCIKNEHSDEAEWAVRGEAAVAAPMSPISPDGYPAEEAPTEPRVAATASSRGQVNRTLVRDRAYAVAR